MSKYIARLILLGMAKEAVRGNGAAPLYSIPFAKLTFADKINQARSQGALGTLEDSEEAFVTMTHGAGDVDMEIRSKSLGLILYALFGGYSVNGPTDSSYTHTYNLAQNNTHQSLAFVIKDPNVAELFKLVMLDSMKISAAVDKVVTYTLPFLSKKGVDTGLVPPAVVHESKFTNRHVFVKLASTIGGLASAPRLPIKTLNFNVMKNAAIDQILGTAEPDDIFNNQFAVEGDLDLNMTDTTYRDYMLNGTYQCMEVDFINSNDTIGAGTHPSLTFQLPKVDFKEWSPSYELDKIVTQKVSWKASRDVANSLAIISLAQLVNDVISY
jgi:hypothetical protein